MREHYRTQNFRRLDWNSTREGGSIIVDGAVTASTPASALTRNFTDPDELMVGGNFSSVEFNECLVFGKLSGTFSGDLELNLHVGNRVQMTSDASFASIDTTNSSFISNTLSNANNLSSIRSFKTNALKVASFQKRCEELEGEREESRRQILTLQRRLESNNQFWADKLAAFDKAESEMLFREINSMGEEENGLNMVADDETGGANSNNSWDLITGGGEREPGFVNQVDEEREGRAHAAITAGNVGDVGGAGGSGGVGGVDEVGYDCDVGDVGYDCDAVYDVYDVYDCGDAAGVNGTAAADDDDVDAARCAGTERSFGQTGSGSEDISDNREAFYGRQISPVTSMPLEGEEVLSASRPSLPDRSLPRYKQLTSRVDESSSEDEDDDDDRYGKDTSGNVLELVDSSAAAKIDSEIARAKVYSDFLIKQISRLCSVHKTMKKGSMFQNMGEAEMLIFLNLSVIDKVFFNIADTKRVRLRPGWHQIARYYECVKCDKSLASVIESIKGNKKTTTLNYIHRDHQCASKDKMEKYRKLKRKAIKQQLKVAKEQGQSTSRSVDEEVDLHEQAITRWIATLEVRNKTELLDLILVIKNMRSLYHNRMAQMIATLLENNRDCLFDTNATRTSEEGWAFKIRSDTQKFMLNLYGFYQENLRDDLLELGITKNEIDSTVKNIENSIGRSLSASIHNMFRKESLESSAELSSMVISLCKYGCTAAVFDQQKLSCVLNNTSDMKKFSEDIGSWINEYREKSKKSLEQENAEWEDEEDSFEDADIDEAHDESVDDVSNDAVSVPSSSQSQEKNKKKTTEEKVRDSDETAETISSASCNVPIDLELDNLDDNSVTLDKDFKKALYREKVHEVSKTLVDNAKEFTKKYENTSMSKNFALFYCSKVPSKLFQKSTGVICLDGTFLKVRGAHLSQEQKGKFRVLLTAVLKLTNGSNLPLGYLLCNGENSQNYNAFVGSLFTVYKEEFDKHFENRMIIISDMAKGLTKCLKEFLPIRFPKVAVKFCVIHLKRNIRLLAKPSNKVRYNNCGKSYTQNVSYMYLASKAINRIIFTRSRKSQEQLQKALPLFLNDTQKTNASMCFKAISSTSLLEKFIKSKSSLDVDPESVVAMKKLRNSAVMVLSKVGNKYNQAMLNLQYGDTTSNGVEQLHCELGTVRLTSKHKLVFSSLLAQQIAQEHQLSNFYHSTASNLTRLFMTSLNQNVLIAMFFDVKKESEKSYEIKFHFSNNLKPKMLMMLKLILLNIHNGFLKRKLSYVEYRDQLFRELIGEAGLEEENDELMNYTVDLKDAIRVRKIDRSQLLCSRCSYESQVEFAMCPHAIAVKLFNHFEQDEEGLSKLKAKYYSGIEKGWSSHVENVAVKRKDRGSNRMHLKSFEAVNEALIKGKAKTKLKKLMEVPIFKTEEELLSHTGLRVKDTVACPESLPMFEMGFLQEEENPSIVKVQVAKLTNDLEHTRKLLINKDKEITKKYSAYHNARGTGKTYKRKLDRVERFMTGRLNKRKR